MTIASDAMVEAFWPADIPRDNKELYKNYAPFVAAALRKHNKVGRNFEEMYAHVWARLVEKDILNLFMSSVSEKMPKQLTAMQACKYAGVTFQQWRVKMWRWHVGTPIRSKHDGRIIGRRQGGWMPTPINANEFIERSRERNAKINPKRIAKGLPPLEETNGLRSKNALYDIDDVMTLLTMEQPLANGRVACPFRKQGPMEQPIEVKATKAHFQAYLSKSVYSDWCNWCRTYKRKWEKDGPMYLRTDEEHDDSNWESNLEDPTGMQQETRAVLKQAYTRLSETLYEGMKGVPKCKPVAQTEMQMFELLERGMPLPEVVKKLDVPDRVRRNIIKSIADIRVRAA
jgi:hypothetical protein